MNVLCPDITKISEEEWLKLRKKGIGGSDAPIILGLSSFRTPLELFWDKTNQPDAYPKEDTFVCKEVGHLLEPLVAKIFESKNPGWKCYKDSRMLVHPRYPFMFADTDFYTIDPRTGEKYIVECKTTNADMLGIKWGKPTENKYPVAYEWQCRHYMAVFDVAGTILICLGGNSENDYRQRVIMRDMEKEKYLIEQEMDFWNNHVLTGIPPLASKSEPTARHYAKTKGTAISTDLIAQYDKLEETRTKLDQELKEIKAESDKIKAQIFELLQGKESLVEYSGIKYMATISERNTTSIPAAKLPNLKLEYPDVFDKYVETSTSRSCSLKKKKGA